MIREVLVGTLAGAKGAVTLSIMFTIPASIAMRSTIICIASVVILITLLLANFVMPLVAPKKSDEYDQRLRAASTDILNNVIADLESRITPENAAAMQVVLDSYTARLEQVQETDVSYIRKHELDEEVLNQQEAYVLAAVNDGKISIKNAQHSIYRIRRSQRMLDRQQKKRRRGNAESTNLVQSLIRRVSRWFRDRRRSDEENLNNMLFIAALEQRALDYLEPMLESEDIDTVRAARALIAEHRATLASVEPRIEKLQLVVADENIDTSKRPLLRRSTYRTMRMMRDANNIYAEALHMELDQIRIASEEGKINKSMAAELREEVYLLQMGLNDNR